MKQTNYCPETVYFPYIKQICILIEQHHFNLNTKTDKGRRVNSRYVIPKGAIVRYSPVHIESEIGLWWFDTIHLEIGV